MDEGSDESDEEPLSVKKNKNKRIANSVSESSDDEVVNAAGKRRKVKQVFEENEEEEEECKTVRRRRNSRRSYSFREDSDGNDKHGSDGHVDDDHVDDNDFVVSDGEGEDKYNESDGDYIPDKRSPSAEKKCKNEGFSTPNRKSSRLRSKVLDKQNKTLPDRRDYLEKISPICTRSGGTKFNSSCQRKTMSNDFVMGRNSYNTERAGDLEESFIEDEEFIASEVDSEEESSENEHRKRKKRKKSNKPKKRKKVDSDSGDSWIDEKKKKSPKHRASSSSSRKKASNNFVMGRHQYNTEKSYELDDSFIEDEDFIASDTSEEENSSDEHCKKKKTKKVGKVKKVRKLDTDSEADISGIDEIIQEVDEKSNKKDIEQNKKESDEPILETRKTFPKRATKSKNYEKTLERLRKARQSGNKDEITNTDSEDGEEINWNESEELSSCPVEDFIVDDEEDSSHGNEEDVHDMLKDVIAGFKKKNKRSKKVAPLSVNASTPLPTSVTEARNKRVLTYDSSSSNEEMDFDDKTGTKQFLEFVSQNNICGVKKLLNDDTLIGCGKGGRTALHIAAMSGYVSIVELLLSKSANTKVEDKFKYIPLGYAAKNKHPSCFKCLLQKADLATFCRDLYKNFDEMNLLHFIVSEPLVSRENIDKDVVACLDIVYSFNKIMFMKFLSQTDAKSSTPLRIAIMQDQVEVAKFLLKHIFAESKKSPNECSTFRTEEGGNILHFCTIYSRNCLAEIIPYVSHHINERDDNGFTPLMYAAEQYDDCLEVLLNFNASVHVTDSDGVTPLHLAASRGNLQSINLLLEFGHKVDCLDNHGWPPLLYANFRASEECVIALFEKNPSQIFCLGNLMNAQNREQRSKNAKIIQETLLSISHIDAYYTLFNDFIGSNLSLLDENNHGCFTKTWRVILSFKNKVRWLRRNCNQIWTASYVNVDRSRVLQCAMEQLSYSFTLDGLDVRFVGEAGSCLGPKREFCTLLIEEMIKPEMMIFMKADGEQYFPVPSQYFFERMLENPDMNKAKPKMKDETIGDLFADGDLETNISDLDLTSFDLDSVLYQEDVDEKSVKVANTGETACVQETSSLRRVLTKKMKERENELNERLEIMRFAGQFAAQVIMNEEIYVGLQLSKPFVKQILGIPLNHPDDLDLYDHQVFTSIKENEIEDLELPFSTDVRNPWNGELEEISLSAEKEKLVTEENKLEYLNHLSEFKLSSSIVKELAMFKKGFFNVIRREKISIFNADEFSLLLNGVSKIDIHDWRKNTVYRGWSSDSLTINWFWSVVSSLREEEKSLLLKFATGTPCVPAGGFSQLVGLGGPNLFTIARAHDVDKLPQASTCFNQLSLPAYSSQKTLREKLLITIRHGCEGFAFA